RVRHAPRSSRACRPSIQSRECRCAWLLLPFSSGLGRLPKIRRSPKLSLPHSAYFPGTRSSPPVTDGGDMNAVRNPGRVAGLWYLLFVLGGPLRRIYIPNKLFVHGDAAAHAVVNLVCRLPPHHTVPAEILRGLWLFAMGALAYKSGFLPRFIGVWLIVNGVAYVVLSLTGLFFPEYQDKLFLSSQPALFGELAIMLWLVIKGARPPELVAARF